MEKEEYLLDLILNSSEKEALNFFKLNSDTINPTYCKLYQDHEFPNYIMIEALKHNFDTLLGEMIQKTPHFDVRTSSSSTLLRELINKQKWDFTKILLEREANPDFPQNKKTVNSCGEEQFSSPLVCLIKAEKEDLAILAVKAGANYNFNSPETSFGNIENEANNRHMKSLIQAIEEQKKIDYQLKIEQKGALSKIFDKINIFRQTDNKQKNQIK